MPDSFPPGSRYYAVETAILKGTDGEEIAYLRRRFIASPEQFQLLRQHWLVEGDRHDNLAAHYLGDPEQSWQICDANAVMKPEELTETIGRRIRITLPDGFPGGRVIKGVQLGLMIGPLVPFPVPQEVVEALESVEVNQNIDQQSGFQLKFSLSSKSTLNTILLLLPKTGLIGLVRVILTVVVNGSPTVLIDGVLTQQKVSPDVNSGKTALTLTGKDLSAAMDHKEMPGFPFPAMPAEARVALLLTKYAFLGIIPVIIPSMYINVPMPTESIPSQDGTDYEYIKKLAGEAGYVFCVEPGPIPGKSFAYWGPKLKLGPVQPALNVAMDAHTNVESMSFTYDSDGPVLPIVRILENKTKVIFKFPLPINPLQPPLGKTGLIPTRIEKIDTTKMTPGQAIKAGLAHSSLSAEVVKGTGTLDVLRYGRLLKARSLVGVRGAGQAFDGHYLVNDVTHSIKRGEYKQNFSLSRNGLISLTSTVPA